MLKSATSYVWEKIKQKDLLFLQGTENFAEVIEKMPIMWTKQPI